MTPWWQRGAIYQIYPRSFQDSDGDGIGDLRGIEARLDHLVALGVDAVWISPIFPSPMADFGYDVADYTGIDPRFGTLADFDRLLAAAHARGLKLLLDFVPNHTLERASVVSAKAAPSRDNPQARLVHLARSRAGRRPAEQLAQRLRRPGVGVGRGDRPILSATPFLKEQPDLNWRNPDVQAAMFDVLRFWFDRGVDGFRIDVLWLAIKHADCRGNPACLITCHSTSMRNPSTPRSNQKRIASTSPLARAGCAS